MRDAFIPPHTLPTVNRQMALVQRPAGTPRASDFECLRGAVPTCGEGGFLVRNLYLSADPAQRGWAADTALTPFGAPMRALAVGIVVDSRDETVVPGDIVYGRFGWQDYAVAGHDDLFSQIRDPQTPISLYAGVLGMPGITAWLALRQLASPCADDLLLVTTAAGAVGSVVGQLARMSGARVVGLTGSDEKAARCVARYGYHQALNYRTGNLAQDLENVAPEGFTIFFDNAGGTIADIALRTMRRHGRIIQCGTAATPAWKPIPTGPRNEREILMRALSWTGFIIFDHRARFPGALEALTAMVLAGQLTHDEEIVSGMDQIATAFEGMMTGRNRGKILAFIGEDRTG
ncbi:MDR family NADP-dependent oxidoreductase [Sphingobium sp. SCG-1]|uniref:MDR family NADP-dependent oxidoreductase n=1 Tax=Sphingobium sp. SCG-1 TaxID=2072936 RepID=UPI0016709FA2|nr:NADP-dependent oxidoreductase [Sphingobium sp. SCG-1]